MITKAITGLLSPGEKQFSTGDAYSGEHFPWHDVRTREHNPAVRLP